MERRILANGLILMLLVAGCARAPGGTAPSAEIPTMEAWQQTAQEVATPEPSPTSSATITVQPAVPPWPTFHGNLRHTGLSPYDTSHVEGIEQWSFETGDGIESSPAIGADGTIYFGGNVTNPHGEGNLGKLYAINPDGTMIWEYTTENWMESSPAVGPDGTIYIGSGREARVYVVNPDGTEMWRFQAEVGVSAVPAIGVDGTIYFGSWNHRLYAIGGPS